MMKARDYFRLLYPDTKKKEGTKPKRSSSTTTQDVLANVNEIKHKHKEIKVIGKTNAFNVILSYYGSNTYKKCEMEANSAIDKFNDALRKLKSNGEFIRHFTTNEENKTILENINKIHYIVDNVTNILIKNNLDDKIDAKEYLGQAVTRFEDMANTLSTIKKDWEQLQSAMQQIQDSKNKFDPSDYEDFEQYCNPLYTRTQSALKAVITSEWFDAYPEVQKSNREQHIADFQSAKKTIEETIEKVKKPEPSSCTDDAIKQVSPEIGTSMTQNKYDTIDLLKASYDDFYQKFVSCETAFNHYKEAFKELRENELNKARITEKVVLTQERKYDDYAETCKEITQLHQDHIAAMERFIDRCKYFTTAIIDEFCQDSKSRVMTSQPYNFKEPVKQLERLKEMTSDIETLAERYVNTLGTRQSTQASLEDIIDRCNKKKGDLNALSFEMINSINSIYDSILHEEKIFSVFEKTIVPIKNHINKMGIKFQNIDTRILDDKVAYSHNTLVNKINLDIEYIAPEDLISAEEWKKELNDQ